MQNAAAGLESWSCAAVWAKFWLQTALHCFAMSVSGAGYLIDRTTVPTLLWCHWWKHMWDKSLLALQSWSSYPLLHHFVCRSTTTTHSKSTWWRQAKLASCLDVRSFPHCSNRNWKKFPSDAHEDWANRLIEHRNRAFRTKHQPLTYINSTISTTHLYTRTNLLRQLTTINTTYTWQTCRCTNYFIVFCLRLCHQIPHLSSLQQDLLMVSSSRKQTSGLFPTA